MFGVGIRATDSNGGYLFFLGGGAGGRGTGGAGRNALIL